MTGTKAIYEYAARAIVPSICGANFDVNSVAVGPSAPPIIPIEAASSPLNPRSIAPKNAKNIPNWAAAPSNIVLGFAIIGPKSVLAPIHKKITGGKIPRWTPWYK